MNGFLQLFLACSLLAASLFSVDCAADNARPQSINEKLQPGISIFYDINPRDLLVLRFEIDLSYKPNMDKSCWIDLFKKYHANVKPDGRYLYAEIEWISIDKKDQLLDFLDLKVTTLPLSYQNEMMFELCNNFSELHQLIKELSEQEQQILESITEPYSGQILLLAKLINDKVIKFFLTCHDMTRIFLNTNAQVREFYSMNMEHIDMLLELFPLFQEEISEMNFDGDCSQVIDLLKQSCKIIKKLVSQLHNIFFYSKKQVNHLLFDLLLLNEEGFNLLRNDFRVQKKQIDKFISMEDVLKVAERIEHLSKQIQEPSFNEDQKTPEQSFKNAAMEILNSQEMITNKILKKNDPTLLELLSRNERLVDIFLSLQDSEIKNLFDTCQSIASMSLQNQLKERISKLEHETNSEAMKKLYSVLPALFEAVSNVRNIDKYRLLFDLLENLKLKFTGDFLNATETNS